MSDVNIFGELVVPTQIGDAVTLTLQEWLPTYLGVVTRAIGKDPGWLVAPNSYVVTDDPDHWPEDEPPAVDIMIPGTLDTPKRDGQRNYRVCWDVRVLTYVTTGDRASTERLAKYYAAAVRLCLIQKGTLGGLAVETTWRGERYDPKTNNRVERTLGCAEVRFGVDVRNVARALGGLLSPPSDPTVAPADWPQAQPGKVTTTIKPQPL